MKKIYSIGRHDGESYTLSKRTFKTDELTNEFISGLPDSSAIITFEENENDDIQTLLSPLLRHNPIEPEPIPRKKVSIVVPIYYEEKLIDQLVSRFIPVVDEIKKTYECEIIFVNDGSTDDSLALLRKHQHLHKGIKIIDLSRNFGHQLAITAGIDYAKGDAVVVIDGDLQDPPEVILDMIEAWEQGAHVAYGVRGERKGETFFKLFTAKVFYRILAWFSEMDMPVDAGDFRLLDRKVVDQLKSIPERNRYIRGLVNWIGFKQVPISYSRDQRFAGTTKYSLKKMVRFAADGITSFSDKPLHLAGYMGMIFGILSICFGLKVIYGFNAGHDYVAGWASTITVICFLGAIQLTMLSVVGQYISRIYSEARQRPLYIVKDYYASE
ncbi:MAG: glycosyltransferase family 2 protein [Oligoflexales bacterium]|nr:glycosyltransferase family 2 protein [Oligoflexales bacterium]